MEEFRFLNISRESWLPTFVRITAESRVDAIELFANQHNMTIRQITDETVSFLCRDRKVFYSVSGTDPWLRVLFG